MTTTRSVGTLSVVRAAGGFDEALGPGSPTHGGEDCEFLVRLVLAGHLLGYEPSAWVWHHHRPGAAGRAGARLPPSRQVSVPVRRGCAPLPVRR